MPRVKTRRRSRGGTKTYTCTGCHKPIEPGEEFYTWSRRFGRYGRTYYRHVACGYPRPTELSSRKTAAIFEVIEDAESRIAAWSPSKDDLSTDEVEEAVNDVGSSAEDVAAEYQESFDNLPENFQAGGTGMAMEEVAQELESWASDLTSWSPSANEPELEGLDDEAAEDAIESWADEVRSEAQDAWSEVPEYQG